MAPGTGDGTPQGVWEAHRAVLTPAAAAGTERLHRYWVHGEGAAKIRWGEPDDFHRCVEHLGKYIKDPKGYCNLAHHAATGMWPAQHAELIKKGTGRSVVTEPAFDADGLDGSWDDPLDDLPDLTGLDVHHFEAAEQALGMQPMGRPIGSERAMPKLGSGGRFKALKAKLAAKGATNPGALAAYIGRRKYGKAKFAKLAAKARGGSSRGEDTPLPFVRSFPLEDISIRAGGDGRTVDAYAAVFETPAPIHDADGDYIEVLDPQVFSRHLAKIGPDVTRTGAWRCGVFYNHALDLHGNPSDMFSIPVGVPVEIKVDRRGLFTRTRYHKGELEDKILERIQAGSLPGYSFSGRFARSTPRRPRGGYHPDFQGTLPVVRRTESTLREYGPTPFPAYTDSVVTAVRADLVTAQLDQVREALRSGTPLEDLPFSLPDDAAAPEWDSVPGDSHPKVRSARSVKEQIQANRAALLQRQHRR